MSRPFTLHQTGSTGNRSLRVMVAGHEGRPKDRVYVELDDRTREEIFQSTKLAECSSPGSHPGSLPDGGTEPACAFLRISPTQLLLRISDIMSTTPLQSLPASSVDESDCREDSMRFMADSARGCALVSRPFRSTGTTSGGVSGSAKRATMRMVSLPIWKDRGRYAQFPVLCYKDWEARRL